MFGSRGDYLEHFELTIPQSLYDDWRTCFIYHRLALYTIKENLGSPVWMGDGRVSVASAASINKATATYNRGEMSFQMFDITDDVGAMMSTTTIGTTSLWALRQKIGNAALPEFLIKYIERTNMPRKNISNILSHFELQITPSLIFQLAP